MRSATDSTDQTHIQRGMRSTPTTEQMRRRRHLAEFVAIAALADAFRTPDGHAPR